MNLLNFSEKYYMNTEHIILFGIFIFLMLLIIPSHTESFSNFPEIEDIELNTVNLFTPKVTYTNEKLPFGGHIRIPQKPIVNSDGSNVYYKSVSSNKSVPKCKDYKIPFTFFQPMSKSGNFSTSVQRNTNCDITLKIHANDTWKDDLNMMYGRIWVKN